MPTKRRMQTQPVEYKLFYWEEPFRGIFVQLFLEEIGAKYHKRGASEVYPDKRFKIRHPGMAPPYLYDCKTKKYLSQMPVILMYLAKKYDYLPKRTENFALALKTILDCSDILLEFTRHYGMKMWDKKSWREFRKHRLADWMKVFEKTGVSNGLKANKGFLLGSKISVADIATTALFGTMIHCFPKLSKDLQTNAPHLFALIQRIEARPAIQNFLQKQRKQDQKRYCGGLIEQSLYEMIG